MRLCWCVGVGVLSECGPGICGVAQVRVSRERERERERLLGVSGGAGWLRAAGAGVAGVLRVWMARPLRR